MEEAQLPPNLSASRIHDHNGLVDEVVQPQRRGRNAAKNDGARTTGRRGRAGAAAGDAAKSSWLSPPCA